MVDQELVPVFDAMDEIEAFTYRSMLEEADIEVLERPYEDAWLEGVRQRGLHSQLLVLQPDAERAQALVEAFRAEIASGELTIDEDKDQSE